MKRVLVPLRIKEALSKTGLEYQCRAAAGNNVVITLAGRNIGSVYNNNKNAPDFVDMICGRIEREAQQRAKECS